MGDRRGTARAAGRHILFGAAILALGLTAACSSGPSQKELALLEERRQAMESAEKMVAQKKAEEARLQRKLADKKAELKAAEERKAAAAKNLADFPKE
jgi:septal ring factor EnvC (AmiA/AmiB activator)